jgi:hypothetical protein
VSPFLTPSQRLWLGAIERSGTTRPEGLEWAMTLGFTEVAGKGKDRRHKLTEAGKKVLLDDAEARGESRRARLRRP